MADQQPASQGAAPAADPERVGEAAAAAAADQGATPAQAKAEAREAADAATHHRLPDDQLDAIADRVIDKLEKRGAFETPPPATPPAAEAAPAAAAADTTSETPRAEPVEIPNPPRRRTLAERFVGRQ